MVEEPVGNFLQDVAVVEGFVESRDLGERLGLIRGHFSQERALFQGPCHRREPGASPVEYFGDLVGLGIVVTQIEIGAVERGHGAFDRNDIVVRIGVGVLRERRGDILLDGAVAPVDRGVDRLVEGQACPQVYGTYVEPDDECIEVEARLGNGDRLFGHVGLAVTRRDGDRGGARRCIGIDYGGDLQTLFRAFYSEPVTAFGEGVFPFEIGFYAEFLGFGGSGRERDGF